MTDFQVSEPVPQRSESWSAELWICWASILSSGAGNVFCMVLAGRQIFLLRDSAQMLLPLLAWQSVPYFTGMLLAIGARRNLALSLLTLSVSQIGVAVSSLAYWRAYSWLQVGVEMGPGAGHGANPFPLLALAFLAVVPFGHLLLLSIPAIGLIFGRIWSEARATAAAPESFSDAGWTDDDGANEHAIRS